MTRVSIHTEIYTVYGIKGYEMNYYRFLYVCTYYTTNSAVNNGGIRVGYLLHHYMPDLLPLALSLF